jgi:MFS family permease
MVCVGTLAVGLAYIGYALAPTLLIACVAALPGGIGNGIQWAAFVGVVQGLTPGRLLGRIMGVIEAARSVAPPLGYALGGALALASPRIALFVGGLAASLITIPFVRISAGRVRAIEVAEATVAPPAERSQHEPGVRGVAP